MKPSIICAAVGVALLFIGFPTHATSTCSNPNSILNASYGWQGQGLLAKGGSANPKIGDFIPLVQVGHLTFDGNGNVSGAHDTSLGGTLFPHHDSGTYSVNSDCITGTVSLSNGFTMNIVITGGAQEIEYVSATTGGVNSGTLRLMAASCSASALGAHSFGYSSSGLVVAGNGNALPRVGGFVPFSNAGQISFQADGSVSGVDNLNFGGVVASGRPILGTYTVNADCTGTTTMTIAGADQSWNFVILQGTGKLIFVAVPSGSVWAGTLTEI